MPFELGRPFGVPDDAAFQTRVLKDVLKLLEAESGPLLVDFPDEAPTGAPSAEEDEGWACPVNLPPPASAKDDLVVAVRAETALLAPWYDLAIEARGRTTADSTGLDIDALIDGLASYLESDPESPLDGTPAGVALNLIAEDLKAFYMEAATARTPNDSFHQIRDWFWHQTSASRLYHAVRASRMESADELTRTVAERLIVPVHEWERTAELVGGS